MHPGEMQIRPQVVPEQVDWKQPSAEELAENCLKWFKDYLSTATHDKISDDEFEETLKHYLDLTYDGHCDENFSKLAAMHRFPSKIINKEDVDLLKETA